MRRSQRLIAAAVLISLSGALAGCSGGFSSFDPTDMLDLLDTKKKLPGERKPVFPDGVPGLEQGVPKDLYKGSAQQQLDEQNAREAAAAAPPPEEPKSKQAAKSKTKGKPPATASTAPDGTCRGGRGRGRHRRGAAGSQAQENRAQAHHRAAARSAGHAAGARPTAATIGDAIPGAVAGRHLHALIRVFISLTCAQAQ